MSVRITHVRLSGGSDHSHITHFRWVGIEDGQVDSSSKSQMVSWMEQGGRAFVSDGNTQVEVAVVNPVNGIRYLRTFADDRWTDNLLALPRF